MLNMSLTNVSYLKDFAQAKIQASEEKLNEAMKHFQLAQTEFQVRLQEQDTQNKRLLKISNLSNQPWSKGEREGADSTTGWERTWRQGKQSPC